MGKNQSASGLTNIVQYDNDGNISLVSGSTTLLYISSSGAITTRGIISGSNALSASYAASASNAISGAYAVDATTASYAANATTSSYAVSSSYWSGSITNALSASYADASANAANATLFNSTASSVFSTTGSNTLTGTQYVSNTNNATAFSNTTASIYTDGGLQVTKDAYFSSSMFIKGNLTVFGTQSVSFISSSQLNIGTNLITVNTDTPSIRFGGLAVYDSGSTGLTGSILWDSQNNHWVYTNPSGSSYSGGMFISGPRASSLGSEQGTTLNAIMKGQGGDHITSSIMFESASFVGIGTSSPSVKLDVVGDQVVRDSSTATTYISINASSDVPRFELYNNGTGSMTMGYRGASAPGTASIGELRVQANSPLLFSTNNTERIRITSDGNLLVGTTSLRVTGFTTGNSQYAMENTGYGGAQWFTNRNDNEGTYIVLGKSRGTTVNSNTIVANNDILGGIVFQGTDGTNSEVAAYIRASVDGTPGNNDMPGRLEFLTTADGSANPTERMRITNAGNVGIGTTSPTSLLEASLSQNAQTGIRIRNSTAGTGASVEFGAYTDSGNGGFGKYSTATNPYKNIVAASTFIYNGSSGDIALLNDVPSGNISFAAGGVSTAQMFISGSGNVGIGTTNLRAYKFHLVNSGSNAQFGISNQGTADGNRQLRIGFGGNGANTWAELQGTRLNVADDVNIVLQPGGGNIGIGTTSPSTLLNVHTARTSGANVDVLTLSDNVTGVQTSGFGVRILATSNNGQAKAAIAFEADGGTNNDTAIAFYTQTSAAAMPQRLIIDKNGTVRVNTSISSTNYKFGVSGSAYINGTNNRGVFITDGASYASIVGLNNAISSYNSLELRASGVDGQLYLSSGGNVGFFTTAPTGSVSSNLVHVNGPSAVFRVGPTYPATGAGTDRDYIELLADGANTRLISPNETFSILNPGGGAGSWAIDIVAGSGGVRLTNGATSWSAISSDRRKKKNFEPSQGLAEILQIESVKYHFEWDDDSIPKRMGFIAQNIQPLIPEMVSPTKEKAPDGSDYLTVTPDYILPVLVKAIQELNTKLDVANAEIEALKLK
jgi:hypothetical protein